MPSGIFIRTMIPMKTTTFRLSMQEFEILTEVATYQGISRADFLRRSMLDCAKRILSKRDRVNDQ